MSKIVTGATKYWNNIFFPNTQLAVIRNSHQSFEKDRKLVFRSACNVGKIDVKNYIKAVYDVDVAKVNTLNVQGRVKTPIRGLGKKAKRTGQQYKLPDWKKLSHQRYTFELYLPRFFGFNKEFFVKHRTIPKVMQLWYLKFHRSMDL
eukprot:gene3200-4007_t